jgi:DHA1 family bicyclomycin/chloramphenicol resistance-like MFS transporter
MLRKSSVVLVLLILAPSIVLRALAMDILLSCVPNLARYFNAPFSTSQWILSIFFIGAGFGQLFIGPFADRFGRRPILLISTLIIIVTSFICTQLTDIHWLILFRFLQGLGASGTTVVCMAVVRDLFDDRSIPRIYSYFNSIVSLAPLFAPALGGHLLVWTDSWQSTFYFVGLFSCIAFVLNYFFVMETNPYMLNSKEFSLKTVFSNYLSILKDKKFWGYSWCAIMGMCCLFLFFSMSAILFIERIGMQAELYGFYFALDSALFILGNVLSPQLQRLIGIHATILLGNLFIVLGAIIMFVCDFYSGLKVWNILVPNIISTFGVGLIFGPCMAGVIKNYKHIAGMASALYGALLFGGSAIIVGAIMRFDVIDAKVLALPMLIMGVSNVLVSWITMPLSKQAAQAERDYL